MRYLNSLSDAPIASVIQFSYMGGSQYGATRKVEVTSHTRGGIVGKDFSRGMEYRSFDESKARNVSVVTEPKATPLSATRLTTQTVHFTLARQQLQAKVTRLSGDDLASVYATSVGGINPRFNPTSSSVEYDVPAKTFMVNGQEMTIEELAELVKNNS